MAGDTSRPPDLRDESTTELLKRLSQETTTLVRQEFELAKAETAAKGKEMGFGAGMIGGASLAGMLTLGALTATAILALDTAMPGWLAALIVTAVWAAITGALALLGRERLRAAGPPAPEQTIETAKEDVRWVKTRAKSARK